MAKVHPQITPELQQFIENQHIFFVATAPLSPDGHINLSPKGHDCLRVLSPSRVAYLDLTGSGNETSAHLLENGRITFLFCAFEGAPNILRLYGQGRAVLPGSGEWDELRPLFPTYPGIRQIITAEIERVQTSCGFAIPFFDYAGERETLFKWAENRGEEGLKTYWQQKNRESMDSLPTPLSQNVHNVFPDGGD